MSAREWDAFALPAQVATTELALLSYDEPGVGVRHVDASAPWIARVCDALQDTREALVSRSAASLASVLGSVGARFSDPGDPARAEALALLPATSGLSTEMATAVLDGMAADWSEERLTRLVRAELGDERVLDGFGAAEGDRESGGARVMAVGPRLCVQIVAGSVPGVGVTALLRSLLLKGPTLLKPGRGDVVLPVLFARALREIDPGLADAVAVVYWPGGQPELEDAAMGSADIVVAYGTDETVDALRSRAPVTTRFVAYHHRISVGVVGRDALRDETLDAAAAEVAEAVALFDQRGCVSPQIIFVEDGWAGANAFAEALARALDRIEDRLPSGELDAAQASSVHQLRGTAELLGAPGDLTVIHGGEASWTVLVESAEDSLGECAGRTVRVRAVPDVAEVSALLAPLGPHLQTIGVVGLGERLERVAGALGRLGASRVVPFSAVAFPPPWWHHDGRGTLRELVRWVDLEG